MTKGELSKVPLQIVIATYYAILGDNQKLFLVGPAQAADWALIPLSAVNEVTYNAP